MMMLDIKSVGASYGQHRALTTINLRVKKGEIVVILGSNGAGKSTLLKSISGIFEGKLDGSMLMRGEELVGKPAHQIVEMGIALVPEGRGIFADLSVEENLNLGAFSPRARSDSESNMERVMRLFPKLNERRRQIVRTMSGGEQQMVAIARAMMSNPTLLTLDEPSLGLSPLLCKELFQSLREVRAAGISILMVEQNAKQSLAIADRAYLLENGSILREGSADELQKDPAVQAAYLGIVKNQIKPKPLGEITPMPPVNNGPSPSDIAAMALTALSQQVKDRPKYMKSDLKRMPDTVPAQLVQPNAIRSQESVDVVLGSVEISDLVASAAKASRAQYEKPPSIKKHFIVPAQHALTPRLNANSQDRLRNVLNEIEEAAVHARDWRPTPRRT
jgi:branched-chain amino acid transport system ATP-binding protein